MSIAIPFGYDSRYFEHAVLTVTAIIVVWLVLIGMTGWLAARRGWDDGLWAVLALLTGPVALLIVLLAPKPATPPTPYSGVTFREAAAAPDWPAFPAREPRMTTAQRIVGAALAGLLGAVGASVIASESRPILPIVVAAGAVAGSVLGRWLGPSLVASSTVWKIWIVLVTATVSMSIAAFLSVAILGVPMQVVGTGGIAEYASYLGAAIFYPVVSAIFFPTPMLVAVAASTAWVVATSLVVNRAPASSSVAPPAMHGAR